MATSCENKSPHLPLHNDEGNSPMKDQNRSSKLRDMFQDTEDFSLIRCDSSNALRTLATVLLGCDIKEKTSPAFSDLKLQTSTRDEVSLGIVPLDVAAWGLWAPWDTISVCAIGTPSAETFFELACNRLLDAKEKVTIVNASKSSSTFDLCIATYRVQLSYHSNPLIARWSEIGENTLAEVRSTLPWTSQDRIDDLIKTQQIATKLAQYDFSLIRASYWQYLRWAVFLGLSPNLLDKEHILCLAVWGLDRNISEADFRNLNLPMPAVGSEVENVAASLGLTGTKMEAWKLQTVLQIAGKITLEENRRSHIGHHCSHTKASGFLKSWPWYLKVDLKYWGSSSTQADQWISKVESRLRSTTLSCSKDMTTKAQLHLWPHPFLDDWDKRCDEYLLDSFDCMIGVPGPYLKSDIGQIYSELTYFVGFCSIENEADMDVASICSRFTEALEAGPECSCSVEVLSLSEMTSEWHQSILRHVAIPVDSRKLGIAETHPDNSIEQFPCLSSRKIKKSAARQGHDRQIPASSPLSQHTKSLRPATDILNRLRHDMRFNKDDFLVGYLDRHSGIQELAVNDWVVENTDESFIPQSRIRYFKHKSDGVVWDRNARIDRVFGSGRQDEKKAEEVGDEK